MANTQFTTNLKRKSIAMVASVPTESGSRVVRWFVHATSQAAAVVLTANYFDGNRLNVNDVIDVMSVSDGVGDRLSVKVTAVADASEYTGITVVVNADAAGS